MNKQLIKQLEYGSLYRLDNGLNRIYFDSTVKYQDWDASDNLWRVQRLVMSEAIDIAGGRAIYTGRFGYWTNFKKVRVYPVRGDTSKYLEIGLTFPATLKPRQVGDKYIELYHEQPDGLVRRSLILHERGLKIDILVRKGYSGSGEFRFNFELVGLKRHGRSVYDGDTLIGNLPKSFATDGNGKSFSVSENIDNDMLTLAVDLQGAVWPIRIDPSFGPTNMARGNYVRNVLPIRGHGASAAQFFTVGVAVVTTNVYRALHFLDISEIPPGLPIISAMIGLTVNSSPGILGTEIVNFVRCTRTNWEDNGFGDSNEANWNNYADPNVPWTTPGIDRDESIKDSYIAQNLPDSTAVSYSVINNVTDAVNNRSGLLSMAHMWDDETIVSNQAFYSINPLNLDEKKVNLTVDFEAPADGFSRSFFAQPLGIKRGFQAAGSGQVRNISVKGGFK